MNSKNTGTQRKPTGKTSHPVNPQPSGPPTFSFRLPKAGQIDPYFGGARSYWNARILPSAANNFQPAVQSFVDKKPGTERGVRFILWSSALSYFSRLASEQNRRRPGGETDEKPEDAK